MIGIDCEHIETRDELASDFFCRDVETVAKALIGVFVLNVDRDGTLIGGRIVETEAYSQFDPGAHCFGDKRPPRERNPRKFFDSMYLPGGHVYVYADDSHADDPKYCHLNFTCDGDEGSAVLIRALEPCYNSVATMKSRRLKFIKTLRETDLDQKLCSGPIRLSQALCISYKFDGRPISKTPLRLYQRGDQPTVLCGQRVGVIRGAEKMRRYALRGSSFVSERRNKRFPLPAELCV